MALSHGTSGEGARLFMIFSWTSQNKPRWPLSQGRPLGTGNPREEGPALLPLLGVSAGSCQPGSLLGACLGAKPPQTLSHILGQES